MYIVNIFRLSLDVKREEVWSSHMTHTSLQTENKTRQRIKCCKMTTYFIFTLLDDPYLS